MAVPLVFVSSVQRGFEVARGAARDALLSLRMHPLMAETTGASPSSPQRALLDEVARGDYFLLILGERYGDPGRGGLSPTEAEFNEAKRLGKPIIVLVQHCDREPAQEQFLERVRAGGWEQGMLYAKFRNPEGVGAAIASAFAKLRVDAGAEDLERARARASEIVLGGLRSGSFSGGVVARIALVPTANATLLDAVALEDASLPDDLASFMRARRLAPQEVGLSTQVRSDGVTIRGTSAWESVEVFTEVGTDGAIVAQSSVRGSGGAFAGAIVDPDRLAAFLEGAGGFAQSVWDRIDARQEVRRAALQLAIPDSEYKAYGRSIGSSMSLGGRMPVHVLAPASPDVVNRGELAAPQTARRVVAAARRVFADAGRVRE